LLIVPAGCAIAVVGKVGSTGLPVVAEGGVEGTGSCAIAAYGNAALVNIAQTATTASRAAIPEKPVADTEPFISNPELIPELFIANLT
jgi:hypothetical protein